MRALSLSIENFRSLIRTGPLEIAPLTVLLGPNSSGKTSLIHWLLLLRQTIESRDLTLPLLANGSYVNAGPYRDFISFHETSRPIRFTLSIPLSLSRLPLSLRRPTRGFPSGFEPDPNDSIAIEAHIGYNRRQTTTFLQMATLRVPSRGGPDLEFQIDRRPTTVQGTRYKLTLSYGEHTWVFDGITPYRFFGAFARPMPFRLDGETIDVSSMMSWLRTSIEPIFENIFHLGPIREQPFRHYVATGEAPMDVGLSGQDAGHILWIETKRRKAQRTGLLRAVNQWMATLGLATRISATSLGSGLYSIILIDPATNTAVNLADVGFGVSQVLPVVVESFHAPRNSLLLLEQPEIHLQPAVQALLADLFLEASKSKTILIETHSEHLVARLQRRIAEGEVSREKIQIYYFESGPEGTTITQVRVNELGQIEPDTWPSGFFTQEFEEAIAHARAAAKRGRVQI